MINAITWQLLLVLVGTAILGLLIGISAMRLHQARQLREAYNSNKRTVDKLTAERNGLADENAGMVKALESEQTIARQSQEKYSHLTAQQETLQVHTGLQDQRLEKLKTELHLAEEKCIRLERDFASFKANKLREVRMLKVSSDEWLDNEELPVLNKKVNKLAPQLPTPASFDAVDLDADELNSDLDHTQPIIASELDIPSLAESELPDSVEELEFELVDRDELN